MIKTQKHQQILTQLQTINLRIHLTNSIKELMSIIVCVQTPLKRSGTYPIHFNALLIIRNYLWHFYSRFSYILAIKQQYKIGRSSPPLLTKTVSQPSFESFGNRTLSSVPSTAVVCSVLYDNSNSIATVHILVT